MTARSSLFRKPPAVPVSQFRSHLRNSSARLTGIREAIFLGWDGIDSEVFAVKKRFEINARRPLARESSLENVKFSNSEVLEWPNVSHSLRFEASLRAFVYRAFTRGTQERVGD